MWRETTKHERNRVIFREELDGFLPRRILDFHVHLLNREAVPAGQTFSCAGHPLPQYGFEDFTGDLADAYPGRETFAVCFGAPHIDYDRDVNNRYIASGCDHKRFFPLRLFDPVRDTADGLRRDLADGRFLGIKPYLDYVRKADRNDVEIHEMLPPWCMEVMAERGLLVMLHIPRRERLADALNQRQIEELCTRYPTVTIVLAHIGRAYYLKNVAGHLDRLKDLPNLAYDLAMLNNWEVLEHVFATVPRERLLYATDIPIALAPGKSVEINDQYTYVTPVPWELSISDDHRRIVFTSFLYEELRAIRKAVERLGLGREFVEGLFYGNGMKLLRQVEKRLAKGART